MTGLSVVKRESKSRSESPCGCSVAGMRRNRSTTFTKRIFKSGKCCFRIETAATASIVAMARTQAMIRHAEQAVRVGRQINTDHIRAFVGDHVEKSGILVGDTVVILPPDQRR